MAGYSYSRTPLMWALDSRITTLQHVFNHVAHELFLPPLGPWRVSAPLLSALISRLGLHQLGGAWWLRRADLFFLNGMTACLDADTGYQPQNFSNRSAMKHVTSSPKNRYKCSCFDELATSFLLSCHVLGESRLKKL
jgi:hypothetical protein